MNDCNHIVGVYLPGYDTGTLFTARELENETRLGHEPDEDYESFVFCPMCGERLLEGE